jgi:hypothetical protein
VVCQKRDESIYCQNLQSDPTVTPAATDGIDPVLAYPAIPPPAVRTPRMRAMLSRDYLVSHTIQSNSMSMDMHLQQV